MIPTTAHSAVLKIHIASEALPITGLEGPSVQEPGKIVTQPGVELKPMHRQFYSQLVAVSLSMVDRFSMVQDTLVLLEMLTVR